MTDWKTNNDKRHAQAFLRLVESALESWFFTHQTVPSIGKCNAETMRIIALVGRPMGPQFLVRGKWVQVPEGTGVEFNGIGILLDPAVQNGTINFNDEVDPSHRMSVTCWYA